MKVTSCDLETLICRCVSGNLDARTTFQTLYGPLIYTFPIRIFQLPKDEAGDFYLYVFEKDRVFKRSKSFEGRNAIQFETYLSFFVLQSLFLEWVRTTAHGAAVSLDTPVGEFDPDGKRTPSDPDVLPTAELALDTVLAASEDAQKVARLLHHLDAEKRLTLKLLALDTIELAPDDIRLLAQTASRSIQETLERLEEVRATLSVKSHKAQEKRDALHAVSSWIQTYQHRLTALEEHIRVSSLQGATQAVPPYTKEKAELERKLAWRYQQQAKLRAELQSYDIRPSCKEIASLLNVSLGTVCSRIARAREVFRHALAVTP